MKHLAILLCGILSLPFVQGQYVSAQERPAWVNGYFTERQNSYVEVVSAVGYSEEDARNKAARIIIERRSLATGQRAQIRVVGDNIVVDGSDALTVKSRIVDEYRERLGAGEYRISLLVQTAKNPEFQYEPVHVTDRYKFSPRVFVPGMAQIYKGQNIRGALFISGEVAAIGGIVAFEGLRSSYNSKIKRTHNAKEIQYYINQADIMKNARNGFIAGAVAVYVWNVIDGIVAKGRKHVVVGEANLDFSPYADPMSAGLTLSMTF